MEKAQNSAYPAVLELPLGLVLLPKEAEAHQYEDFACYLLEILQNL
jgi:hypothetical protein